MTKQALNSYQLNGSVRYGMNLSYPSVANVFNVTDKASALDSYERLKMRATKILESNRWLMGRYNDQRTLAIHEKNLQPGKYIKELVGYRLCSKSRIMSSKTF